MDLEITFREHDAVFRLGDYASSVEKVIADHVQGMQNKLKSKSQTILISREFVEKCRAENAALKSQRDTKEREEREARKLQNRFKPWKKLIATLEPKKEKKL